MIEDKTVEGGLWYRICYKTAHLYPAGAMVNTGINGMALFVWLEIRLALIE